MKSAKKMMNCWEMDTSRCLVPTKWHRNSRKTSKKVNSWRQWWKWWEPIESHAVTRRITIRTKEKRSLSRAAATRASPKVTIILSVSQIYLTLQSHSELRQMLAAPRKYHFSQVEIAMVVGRLRTQLRIVLQASLIIPLRTQPGLFCRIRKNQDLNLHVELVMQPP